MWILILTLMGNGKAIESIYFETHKACVSAGDTWLTQNRSVLTGGNFICVEDGSDE